MDREVERAACLIREANMNMVPGALPGEVKKNPILWTGRIQLYRQMAHGPHFSPETEQKSGNGGHAHLPGMWHGQRED